jgi:hypothetical protein
MSGYYLRYASPKSRFVKGVFDAAAVEVVLELLDLGNNCGLMGMIGLIGSLTISPLAPTAGSFKEGINLRIEVDRLTLGLCVSTASMSTTWY